MARISDIIAAAELLWPTSGADDWDRPGLIAGSFHLDVSRVLLTVDVTSEVIDDAIAGNFDLVFSHHPFLLRGVTTIAENTAKGNVLAKSIRNDIALFAAHTNADITSTGVSATLAGAIGLPHAIPLVSTGQDLGHGRIGVLPESVPLVDFARAVAASLPATAGGVQVAGDPAQAIKKVALCGGAGDSFAAAALQEGADVYITSDMRHHPTQDVLESAAALGRKFAVINISHWAAESLWLKVAAKELEKALPGVKFEVSDLRTDPWDFAVTQ
ncbi:MAG: Nif3-like dinuclear metal center hexameric protein [Micrococcales bacterium]